MDNAEQLASIQAGIRDLYEAGDDGFLEFEDIANLRRQELALRLKIAREWETDIDQEESELGDLTVLGPDVPVPQKVLDLLAVWFVDNLDRDEHLVIAAEADDRVHLRAIQMLLS